MESAGPFFHLCKLSWKFILRTCLFYCIFAAPLRASFSLILRFCWNLVLRALCVNVLFSSVIVFFSFSGLLFFHNFHCLLQCCALVIRMCTICITRFLIYVYSLASQRLTYNMFGITVTTRRQNFWPGY